MNQASLQPLLSLFLWSRDFAQGPQPIMVLTDPLCNPKVHLGLTSKAHSMNYFAVLCQVSFHTEMLKLGREVIVSTWDCVQQYL